MSATKSLHQYLRLRARRAKLAAMPPPEKGTVPEVFTPAEAEQLRVAELQLDRLNGAAVVELLIANRSTLLSYFTRE